MSGFAMDRNQNIVRCQSCREEIDLSEGAKRRRSTIPTWLRCSFCMDVYHSRCSNIPSKCSRIALYNWECAQCRRCLLCQKDDDDGMMFCDGCDRGCHGRCLVPPVNVTNGDETPFLCKDCIEAKHTTRGFRRTKILGCDIRRQPLLRNNSPKKSRKLQQPRKKRQRHSESLETENEVSSVDEEDHPLCDPLPQSCPATSCDGSGHLNGKNEKHFSLDTCPVYCSLTAAEIKMYTETLATLKEGPGQIHMNKTARENIESLLKLSDGKASKPKAEKIRKPTDVFESPRLEGVSDFSKILFQMSKVSHAMNKPCVESHRGRSQRFIQHIQIGKYVVDVKEMSATVRDEALHKEVYFCDVCLDISHDKVQFARMLSKCGCDSPPGLEIYSKHDLTVYEIDGRQHREFCQNLSLLSRFFLSTKAVCYDVMYMMYYVLAQRGPDGRSRPVGYFSKDKDLDKNTLACILVFPPYEQQGFGKLLIDLSYIIARSTQKPGTPERPLSRPGVLAFTSYWQCAVSQALLSSWNACDQFTTLMENLVDQLGMAKDDIEDTLTRMDVIKTDAKTKKLMLLKAPIRDLLEEHAKKWEYLRAVGKRIDPHYLKKNWMKLLPTRKRIE